MKEEGLSRRGGGGGGHSRSSKEEVSSREAAYEAARKEEKERKQEERMLMREEQRAREERLRQQEAEEVHQRRLEAELREKLERKRASSQQHRPEKDRERQERDLRRERFLEAERVKEAYRKDTEERRMRRDRERSRSRERTELDRDPSVFMIPTDEEIKLKTEAENGAGAAALVVLSDESLSPPSAAPQAAAAPGKEAVDTGQDRAATEGEDEEEEEGEQESSDDTDSSTDSNQGESDDDDEEDGDDESSKRSRILAASPPPLAAAAAATPDDGDAEMQLEKDAGLPPYLPAIQGCRSVEEFQCLNRIEEGTYGVVYRARDKRTDEIVALKRLKMEKEKEGFPITSLREINTLLKAQHPNIVTVREIVVGSNMDKIFIVMDYVEHDLKSLMETMKHKKQVFIPVEVKCLMTQLLCAVAHLHDNWILHRDLKASNLLLSHKGVLKVGDFGLAREYGSPLKCYTPIVVTLWYRAPELLLNAKEYSTPVDMWSVGCIFAELLSMEPLFPGKSEIDQLNKIFRTLGTPNERIWPGYSKLPAVQKMTFTEYPVSQLRQRFSVLTDAGLSLLNKFLTYNPAERITAEKAAKHEYFSELPLAIDPAMFPTWPAKSELGHRKAIASPKPPSGGRDYKQLGDTDEGFHMGVVERSRNVLGPGFSLKF